MRVKTSAYRIRYRYYKNIVFYLQYAYPNNRRKNPKPFRVLMTPIIKGGQRVTKNMLGRDSKEYLAKPVYAKSYRQYHKEVFNEAAEEIWQMLLAAGLVEDTGSQETEEDLSQWLAAIRDAIFMQNSKWAASTKASYSGQYSILIQETKGVNISALGNENYTKLQEKICRNAADNSPTAFWHPGEKPPPSAATRLFLLRLGIEYLQKQEGLTISCDAKRYLGRKRRTDELMDLLENARFFPTESLEAIAQCLPKTFDLMPVLFATQLDTGLRISELTGLVWADVRWLDGSQGRMYYLFITGQLNAKGKRTSITKTVNAYRYVPLAGAIGTLLYNEYQRLAGIRKDIRRCMIISTAQGQGEECSPSENNARKAAYAQYFDKILEQFKIPEKLQEIHPYVFNKASQNEHLRRNLTPHSLRRNFCSMLYANSGVDTLEIFHQMGHDTSPILLKKRSSPSTGKTDTELYQMCLTHEMHSVYSHRDSLFYDLDGGSFYTDIPAFRTVLTVQPGQHVQIDVQDTQTGNQVEIQAAETMDCQCIHYSSTAATPAHLGPVQFPQEEGQYIHPEEYLPAPR